MSKLFEVVFVDGGGKVPGKLADVELHFTDAAGPLAGLKLIGFGLWQRRSGGGNNVTFPARAYTVNGERRSFALLRPSKDANATDAIRDAILQAWDATLAGTYEVTPEGRTALYDSQLTGKLAGATAAVSR